jgi:hypothetical protein
MDAKPGPGAGTRSVSWRRVSDWSFSRWWKAIVGVVLASTAMFGGLDTVDTSVTTFKPGDEFSDGEFTVKLERATLVRELHAGGTVLGREKPGRRYLGVVAQLRNDGTTPGRLAGELDLRNVPDNVFVGAMRLGDGSRIATLGPGLSEQVAFVWELPENAVAVGDTVTLRVWKKQFRQGMATYGEAWVDSLTDYGETVVPVGGPR